MGSSKKLQCDVAIRGVLARYPAPRTERELRTLFRGPVSQAYPWGERCAWSYRVWCDRARVFREAFAPAVFGAAIVVSCPRCGVRKNRVCTMSGGDQIMGLLTVDIALAEITEIHHAREVVGDAERDGEWDALAALRLLTFHPQRVERWRGTNHLEGATLPLFGAAA